MQQRLVGDALAAVSSPRCRKTDGLLAVLAETRKRAPEQLWQGTGDMKTHEARRKIIRAWMALPKDRRETEEQMQRIVNAFFFGVTIFSIAFAYFVLSAKAQDPHYPLEHAQFMDGQ
jgi:hypothetical protein